MGQVELLLEIANYHRSSLLSGIIKTSSNNVPNISPVLTFEIMFVRRCKVDERRKLCSKYTIIKKIFFFLTRILKIFISKKLSIRQIGLAVLPIKAVINRSSWILCLLYCQLLFNFENLLNNDLSILIIMIKF